MVNSLLVKRANYYLLSLDISSEVLAVVSRPTRHGSERTKAAGAEFKAVCRRCTLPLAVFVSGLGMAHKDDLLVFKIMEQQPAFALVGEILVLL